MLVDDDPNLILLVKDYLEFRGYNVITAENGRHALEKLEEEIPDLIICDVMMPEMDGWQVCKEVRTFSTVPIVILSALDTPGLVAAALDAGADDYLIKPVPSSALIAHINKLVRRKHIEQLNLSTIPT